MEPRFSCTACGKCCHGWLPLTLKDAVAHAGRFPLAMVWTPVRANARSYELATRLGATVRLPNRKTVAVLIVPTAYLPTAFPCPELREDGLCGIHDDQAVALPHHALLSLPRGEGPGRPADPAQGLAMRHLGGGAGRLQQSRHPRSWDFARERDDLRDQAPVIQRYADYVLKYMPWIVDELAKLAAKPTGGNLVTSLSSFLTATRRPDAVDIAAAQAPLFRAMAERTKDDPALRDYHRNYSGWAKEMEGLARRKPA